MDRPAVRKFVGVPLASDHAFSVAAHTLLTSAGCERAGYRGTAITKKQFTACICTKICHFHGKNGQKCPRGFAPQTSS